MKDEYEIYDIYAETQHFLGETYENDEAYKEILDAIRSGESVIGLNKKALKRRIDESWVSKIEESLVSLDNAIRKPGRHIQENEEVLPIELSRNITPRSLQHLGQHSDYISKVEGDSVLPSKILNVYKDETMETYENKFINTLIDRLYMFVHKRYDKMKAFTDDENSTVLDFSTEVEKNGTQVKINIKLESYDVNKEEVNDVGEKHDSLYERVVKLIRIVDGYKSSSFVKNMNNKFVRPPIMRTNAILKNNDYKKCLELWQFIESYTKVGYEIDAHESAEKPDDSYIQMLYAVTALQYSTFAIGTSCDDEQRAVLKKRKTKKPVEPKFVKKFEEDLVNDMDQVDTEYKKVAQINPLNPRSRLTDTEASIKNAIDTAIKNYKVFLAEEERERRRKLEEEERIRKARELARIKKEQARARAEQLERERKEKEKEKERLRLQKEKQEEAERIRKQKQKEKEKLRLQKLREAEAQKIKEAKAKEKEKLAKQKAAEKEKERLAKEKEKEKQRKALEKAKAKEIEKKLAEAEKAMRALKKKREKIGSDNKAAEGENK